MPDGLPQLDPAPLATRIAALLRERRPSAAKLLLAALARLAPDHPDLPLLRSGYHWQLGEAAEALSVLIEAQSIDPDNPEIPLRQAEIFFSQGEHARAVEAAEHVLRLAPELARAQSVLGLSLLHLGRYQAAEPRLAEAFAADPRAVDVALALAALRPPGAAAVLAEAIAANPRLGVLRNALIRRHLLDGRLADAALAARQSRAAGVADVEGFCLQAVTEIEQAEFAAAETSVAQALSLVPGHRWARRLAAALSGRHRGHLDLPLPDWADPLAAEAALVAGGIVLPGSFRAMLETRPAGPVLDLFCGTGLNAVAAHDIAGPWSGVDPSTAALELAGARGLYAALYQGDPLEGLDTADQAVILLNEALAYTAEPQSWLSALRGALAPDGIALAAIPQGHGALTGHGLYGHDPAGLADRARQAGLTFRQERQGVLRFSEGLPVHGVIAAFTVA